MAVFIVIVTGKGSITSIGSVLTLAVFPTPGPAGPTWEMCLMGTPHTPENCKGKENTPMADRQRKRPLFFYVTDNELALIEEKMKLLKTQNKSAYLRKMALDGYIVNVDYSIIKENTAQLQRIGGNINQIVKRMNQTGSLYAADVAEVKELVKEIWRTQRFILSSQRWTRR